MVRSNPVATSAEYVDEFFPHAEAVILAGSSITTHCTDYSDLDLVIVDNTLRSPYRHTVRIFDWLAELFVHNDASLSHFWRRDVQSRRPILIRMCATGQPLRGAPGPAEAIQREAALILEAGPQVPAEELDYRRYILTALRDDYLGCHDPYESTFIANALLTTASELALLTRNAWLGDGKWLARELATVHPELAERATTAAAPTGSGLQAFVEQILELAGGPLQEGYLAHAQLPNPT